MAGMRTRPLLAVLSFLAAPVLLFWGGPGCVGGVTEDFTDPTADAGKDAKHDAKADAGVPPLGDGGGSKDALPDYVDPGCPDAGPPLQQFACDPYKQNNGDCMPGDACYIFVTYPQETCGQEIYGSVCYQAGQGVQGSPCGGAQDCGGGFVCVVSGAGNECVELCQLSGNSGCPDGLVCEPIDVEGFGGCL